METVNKVDKIEILILVDNYIDILLRDNSDIVTRASSFKEKKLSNAILAEHAFSALIKTTVGDKTRTMIFDFGFSWDTAARNADALDVDLTEVELAALSHGHKDHHGGMAEIMGKIGKRGLEFITHPAVFRSNRYVRHDNDDKVEMPSPDQKAIEEMGFRIVRKKEPYLLLGGDVMFLGEIPRRTSFEAGVPNTYYEEHGKEMLDLLEDDTSLVMNIKGKGLVILSGCAHSGIINTVEYAQEVTGILDVHAVVGGFHLTGPAFEPVIDDTVNAMKEIGPDYVIPAHCTGRKAMLAFEKAMPDQFIISMSGTKLTFSV